MNQHTRMIAKLRLFSFLLVLCPLVFSSFALAAEPERLDLVACGRLLTWTNLEKDEPASVAGMNDLPSGTRAVGVIWNEDRDVEEIRLTFRSDVKVGELQVQYWFNTWPPSPPKINSFDDPADDIWQGRWLTAQTRQTQEGQSVKVTFVPFEHERE